MINKKIYIILLSFIFVFISCNEDSSLESQSLDMKLVSFSGAKGDFNGMVSFKVAALKDGKAIAESDCKTYSNTKEVTFDIGEGEFTFKFSGYKAHDCKEAEMKWSGKTTVSLKPGIINKITIPIGKIGEFSKSSEELHAAAAFMSAHVMDGKIILSGGISSITKNLTRTRKEARADCNSNDFILECSCELNACNESIPLLVSACEAQGMSTERCIECLEVKDNKFVKSSGDCLIDSCPLSLPGGDCNLKGTSNIQYVDALDLDSGLFSIGKVALSLSELRIFHKSYFHGGKLYFIGGSPEGFLNRKAPFISFTKYADHQTRNMMDVYDGETVKSPNILGPNINVGFNILPELDDSFTVFGGKTAIATSISTLYKSSLNILNIDSHDLSTPSLLGANIGVSTTINPNTDENFLLGGVELLENDKLGYLGLKKYSGNKLEGLSSLLDEVKLYEPEVFSHDDYIYAVRGLKFGIESVKGKDNIVFSSVASVFNNNIIRFKKEATGNYTKLSKVALPEELENIIFSSIIEYKYNGQDGLLFVGGLKKNDGKFKAVATVRFISYDDLSSDDAGSKFVTLDNLEVARFAHSTVFYNDKIWVMGGLVESATDNNDFIVERSIEIFIDK